MHKMCSELWQKTEKQILKMLQALSDYDYLGK